MCYRECILGPLLFILFVNDNDLPLHSNQNLDLYADDPTLHFSSNSINELNHTLSSAMETLNNGVHLTGCWLIKKRLNQWRFARTKRHHPNMFLARVFRSSALQVCRIYNSDIIISIKIASRKTRSTDATNGIYL